MFICGLTPFNDYVVDNSFLVGNFLPLGLLLFFIAFILLVNAPLHRWKPRFALSSGEIAVALGMTLVSCTLPSSGLMRYLPAHLVGFWSQAQTALQYRSLLNELHLPHWMFPGRSPVTVADKMNDPVINNYYSRTAFTGDGFWAHVRAVPWSAWLQPAAGWGLLLLCLYGAVLCLCILVRRQWVENERLAFPLVSVYSALIEQPEPGRAFNALFRSRLFWVATATVFFAHSLNALHLYFPRYVPGVGLKYDLTTMFADEPWKYAHNSFKVATICFTVIGVVYFLESSLAFSLLFWYLVLQVFVRMVYGMYGADLTTGMSTDLITGSLVPYAAALFWLGRRHWLLIIRQMFHGPSSGDPTERYLSNRTAGWGFVLFTAGLMTWLLVVGMTAAGAIVLIAMLYLLVMIAARIVAETGLLFVQIPVPLGRPWVYLAGTVANPGLRTTLLSYFYTSWFSTVFAGDLRETFSVYAMHSLRTLDETDAEPARAGPTWKFVACLALALFVGYLAAGASMLYCEYAYSSSLDETQESPINSFGMIDAVRATLQSGADYRPPGAGPRESHNRTAYVAAGFGVTAALSCMRLRFVGWPFHPIGFMLAYTYPMQRIWFSIMVGWMAKALLVRIGGTTLYRQAKPAFIGLILGEAIAAAFWLVVSLVLVGFGQPFHAIQLLPR